MRSGMLLFGSMTVDINYLIDHWPDQDTLAEISQVEILPGGPPQNCANALRKLGAPFPISIESALGDDDKADIITRISVANGLDMSAVRRLPGIASPQTHVMIDSSTGRRTFFYYPGANAHIVAEDFNASNAANARIFYAGAPGLLSAMDNCGADKRGWAGLFAKAKAAGFRTTIEMVTISPAENARLVLPVLPHLDYLIINDSEAGALVDMPLQQNNHFHWDAAARACETLLNRGVSEIVAIHHPDGAVAIRRGEQPVAAGSVNVPREMVKSTVGAGDAFSAGFHYGLHEAWNVTDCLALGNAAAATSLRSVSTTNSIVPAQQCLEFAAACGLRATNL